MDRRRKVLKGKCYLLEEQESKIRLKVDRHLLLPGKNFIRIFLFIISVSLFLSLFSFFKFCSSTLVSKTENKLTLVGTTTSNTSPQPGCSHWDREFGEANLQ